MTPIVTGADIFRAKKTLTAAEIFALDTTPVLIVPAVPGKALKVIAWLEKFIFGTVEYNFAAAASAQARYGNLAGDPQPLGTTELVNALASAQSASRDGGNAIAGAIGADTAGGLGLLSAVQGIGIYLVGIVDGFISGSAKTATVTGGHAGLLYALNDTGNITQGDGNAVYTVTGVGGGGAVTTVTVTGGTGLFPAAGVATTVLTGSGDGNLQLTITAVNDLGDGTIELDVLYQPV